MTFELKKIGLVLMALYVLIAASATASYAYPFTAPGASTGQKTFLTGETTTAHKWLTPNGTVSCTTVSFSGSVTGPEQTSLNLAPSYSGCSAFGFATAHIAVNGCTYRFEAPTTEPSAGSYTGAPFQIICPAGKEIEITPTTFGVSACTQKIPEQTPTKGHVVYANNSELGAQMDYSATPTVEAVHYTGTGGLCGKSETHSDATYSGQTTLKGYEDEGHKLPYGMTVGVPGPSPFPFTAPGAESSKPTYLTGQLTITHSIATPGATYRCTSVSFSGSMVGPDRYSVDLIPVYSLCSAFATVTMHAKTNGCVYRFPAPVTKLSASEFTGEPFRIVCPAGKKLEFTWTNSGSSICTQTIAEQAPTKGHVVYINESGSPSDFQISTFGENIAITSTGGLCGPSGTGSLSGQTTIRGYSSAGHFSPFGVAVG